MLVGIPGHGEVVEQIGMHALIQVSKLCLERGGLRRCGTCIAKGGAWREVSSSKCRPVTYEQGTAPEHCQEGVLALHVHVQLLLRGLKQRPPTW